MPTSLGRTVGISASATVSEGAAVSAGTPLSAMVASAARGAIVIALGWDDADGAKALAPERRAAAQKAATESLILMDWL